MALNGGSLNSFPLNGAAATGTSTGSTKINIVQMVESTGQTVINAEQIVGVYGQTAAGVNQIVEVHSLGSTTILAEQKVVALATPIVDIEQIVLDNAVVDFHTRNGYEPRLFIDGQPVSVDEIHGQITVTFREREAPQLQFTLIPPRGMQDIRSYRGKTVLVNVREGGTTTRVFTGKINTPDVMIIGQKIRFNCSLDIEQEVENNVSQGFINSIGFYDTTMFSTPRQKIDELNDRLTTVPQVMDWDAFGQIRIHDIAPKASPDYTLGNADVYRDNLDYVFSSQQRYINRVSIKAKYSFQRLHHYQINFDGGMRVNSFCNWYLKRYTPMRRDLMYSAATGAGWPITNMQYQDFFESGYYNCSGLITGGTVGFITLKCNSETKAKQDGVGNPITVNGEQQYETVNTACQDTRSALCLSASWTGSTHFGQNIDRDYNLVVESPQSIADYGLKNKDEAYNFTDGYNSDEWENYTEYDNTPPSGFSKTGQIGPNFWVDTDTDKQTFNKAVNVLLNRAKSDILKSHRDDRVLFRRRLWTALNLGNTVRLNTDRVKATGKVFEYTHVMDVNTGEDYTDVTLVLSRSTGSATDTPLGLPSIDMSPTTPNYPIGSIQYDANYGIDVNEVANPSGYYGNYLETKTGGLELTNVPVSFVVAIPEIPSNLRQLRSATNTTSFDVSIPNNELEISFTDDNYK